MPTVGGISQDYDGTLLDPISELHMPLDRKRIFWVDSVRGSPPLRHPVRQDVSAGGPGGDIVLFYNLWRWMALSPSQV